MTIYKKHSPQDAEASASAESETKSTSKSRKYLRKGLLFVLLPALAVGGLAGAALAITDDSNRDGAHSHAKNTEGAANDRIHTGREHARGTRGQIFTDLLGVSSDEIRAAHSEGSTLVEIAAANGVSEQELVDALVQALVSRAQEHDKVLTTDRLASVRARILDRVNGVFDSDRFGGLRGHHKFGDSNADAA